MRVAIASWDHRIAALFDTADELRILCVEDGVVVSNEGVELKAGSDNERVKRLQQLGVENLVCGAISRPLQELVVAAGIQLLPFVSGELSDVVEAYLHGALGDEKFVMPGCCQQRRYRGGDLCQRENGTFLKGRGGCGAAQNYPLKQEKNNATGR